MGGPEPGLRYHLVFSILDETELKLERMFDIQYRNRSH